MPNAPVDRVHDVRTLGCMNASFMRDLHVEITFALKVIAQVSISLIQQIVVDCAFLINRNQPL